MDKTYEPAPASRGIGTSTGSARDYFAPGGAGEPYCIMIPPPNVTGTLHMGHAFQDTIMDALIRYHRMQAVAAPCGSRVPITRVSRRRWWWSARSTPKG